MAGHRPPIAAGEGHPRPGLPPPDTDFSPRVHIPPALRRLGVTTAEAGANIRATMTGSRRDWEDARIAEIRERYALGWIRIEDVEEEIDSVLAAEHR